MSELILKKEWFV
jgi:calcium-dependent protein kinase